MIKMNELPDSISLTAELSELYTWLNHNREYAPDATLPFFQPNDTAGREEHKLLVLEYTGKIKEWNEKLEAHIKETQELDNLTVSQMRNNQESQDAFRKAINDLIEEEIVRLKNCLPEEAIKSQWFPSWVGTTRDRLWRTIGF